MFRRRFFRAPHVEQSAVRLREQAEALAEHVGRGDRVLEVGCGPAALSAYLRDSYGTVPTGIAVTDARAGEIPFAEFDGASIPFPDNSFDHVVLNAVLHHSRDPIGLAAECRRVARRRIMVFEDMPEGLLGKVALYAHMHSVGDARRPPADFDEYRKALAWLRTTATDMTRAELPSGWLTIYPRVLFVYELAS